MEMRVRAKRGESIRQLAQAMGMSRNTVRRYLRGAEAQRQASARPSKLDPYKEYLGERIAQARPNWIAATVLIREIAERGYEGGVGQVKACIRMKKPVPRPEPVVRFETAPASRCRRISWCAGAASCRCWPCGDAGLQPGELRALHHRRRRRHCRRLPARGVRVLRRRPAHVLFDNAKTVIITRDAYGIRLAPMQCRAARPRQGLRFHAASVPPVSSQDQGQGRALQPLSARRLLRAAGGQHRPGCRSMRETANAKSGAGCARSPMRVCTQPRKGSRRATERERAACCRTPPIAGARSLGPMP